MTDLTIVTISLFFFLWNYSTAAWSWRNCRILWWMSNGCKNQNLDPSSKLDKACQEDQTPSTSKKALQVSVIQARMDQGLVVKAFLFFFFCKSRQRKASASRTSQHQSALGPFLRVPLPGFAKKKNQNALSSGYQQLMGHLIFWPPVLDAFWSELHFCRYCRLDCQMEVRLNNHMCIVMEQQLQNAKGTMTILRQQKNQVGGSERWQF